ncbi:HAD family hydrolase [Streptomyces sp. NPDC020472]|uniref:HAD family hydrolase n=1 Tax=unclassified Streptomyces TaxID=2593676 RepID=UPI0036CAC7B3
MELPEDCAGVLLDIDDTLIDFSGASPAALAHVLGPDADFTEWMELTEELYPRFTAGAIDYRELERRRLAALLTRMGRPVPDVPELDAVEARRRREVESRLRLYPDVLPFLTRVRASGRRIGVLSNSDGPQQRRRLEQLGLTSWLDAVTVSGETGVAKPRREAFALACRRLGVPAARTVHIGDSLDADALGAHGAGLGAVWLHRPHRGPAPAPPARGIAVVTTLDALG